MNDAVPTADSAELDPDAVQGVADIIARWDYVTSTGQQPDSAESLVLPPHIEVAGAVISWLQTSGKRMARENMIAAAYQALEDCGVWSPRPEAEDVVDAILKGAAHV